MIECRILSDENEMEALAAPWRALQLRCGVAPYTGYDEAMLWWRGMGKPSGATLRVVVCFDDKGLIGVIPCVVVRRLGVRVLYLLGHDVYYYRGFLVADPCCVPALWQTLLLDKSYDIACIKEVHHGSDEERFLSSVTPPFETGIARYYRHQGETREILFSRYPKSMRRRLRRIEEKCAAGEIEMGCCAFQPPPDELVDFLVDYKAQWSRNHGLKGPLATESGCAWFKDLVRYIGAQGRGVMFWMKWNGRLAAVSYGVVQDRVVYGHLCSYDPEAAHLGPGMVLTAYETAWAAENGYSESNFMAGNEPYKEIISNALYVISDFLVPRTLRGQLYKLLYRGLLMYRQKRRS